MRIINPNPYKFLIAAALIIPALLFTFIIWQDYKNILLAARTEVDRTVNVFEQHALNVFETHQLVAERINDRLKGMSWDEIEHSTEIRDYLIEIEKEYSQIGGLWLADSSGILRNASRKLPDTPVSVADRDYFQALKKNSYELFIGHIITPRVLNNLNFNVAHRRAGSSDNFDGVIIVTAMPDYFANFWKSATSQSNSATVLMRSDGALLARSLGIDPKRLFLPPDSDPLKVIKSSDKGSYIAEAVHDGTRRIFGFHKIAKYNVYLFYGLSMSAVLQKWMEHIVIYGLFFIIATVVLFLFAKSAQEHSISLQRAQQALQKAHDEMELRVNERTEELAISIISLQNEIKEREQAESSLHEATIERLKAVEALRENERMLILQNRQAAMGEMIGNIAHQWRQPLNVLGLTVQQQMLMYELGQFNKEYLEKHISKSMGIISHMSGTIDDFKNYFKPDKEMTRFNVHDAVVNTISLLEGSMQNSKVAIEINAKDKPVINGYRNEYSQVILNILTNANDAFMECRIDNPRILITISGGDGQAVVTIADNAGGIPEEIIENIFDPYFTTKGAQQGTGIGLYMSKTIIEKNMWGSLTVRNVDGGAEFRIEVGNASHV